MEDRNGYPAQVLAERARTRPDDVYLLFDDNRITYRQLNERVNRLADGLRKLGARAGDGIAIMMPNRPEWLYAFFATQKLAAYVVPVNIGLKGEGLSYILNHSEASYLIVGAELIPQVMPIRAAVPGIRKIVVDASEAELPDDTMPADAILVGDVMDSSSADEPDVAIDPAAISSLMYTSGTTGLPKGVVMRYGATNLSSNPMLLLRIYRDGDILYTCLPLFHANALLLTVIRALAEGLTVALSQRFSASRFWDEIRRHGATTFNALGAMIPILLKQPPRPDDVDNPVRVVLSAATPAWAWEQFEKRFDVTIWEGYGAVDGGGFTILNFGWAPKGSMGKPPPGVEAKIVDEEGNEAAAGNVGNLVFKVDRPEARRVDYFKNAEASSSKIRDGWFYTGDLAWRDGEGNFYFADRKTDSMRRRGENISSFEVEKIVNQHPAVLESAAFGVPFELGEDDVMVAVVLKPGESVAPEELVRFCDERMASFMVPRYIDFRASLPKTETHRVQKAVLKTEGVRSSTWDRGTGEPIGNRARA